MVSVEGIEHSEPGLPGLGHDGTQFAHSSSMRSLLVELTMSMSQLAIQDRRNQAPLTAAGLASCAEVVIWFWTDVDKPSERLFLPICEEILMQHKLAKC